jgi:hypothetical protein
MIGPWTGAVGPWQPASLAYLLKEILPKEAGFVDPLLVLAVIFQAKELPFGTAPS